jgi:hypothetical protein
VDDPLGYGTASGSFDRGERPGAVEDFRSGAVEPNDVVPAVGDRQTVGAAVAAAAEVDGDRAVIFGCGGDVVDAVGISIVLLAGSCKSRLM